MKISFEGGNRLLPLVTLDDKYYQNLCTPWKEVLVVKLLGKTVGYNVMKERLKKLLKLSRGFDIMDIDKGYFMVKCDLPSDKERIVSEGPFHGCYLTTALQFFIGL